MSACTSKILLISGTECIGDSWPKINNNFQNLSADICTVSTFANLVSSTLIQLSSTVLNLSAKDSSTIDLTFNRFSYTLSADILNNSIGTSKLGGDISSSAKTLLTTVRLSSLTDIQLNGLSGGQILKWNSSLNKWVNTFEDVLSGTIPNGVYQDIVVSSGPGPVGQVWVINTNAVTETKIIDNAITTNKIIAQGVTTTRIQDQAITAIKLLTATGQEAVTTSALRNNAVTTEKLNSTLGQEAVNTPVIRDQAVTNAKLSAMPGLSIKGNSTSATGQPVDISAVNTGESSIVEQNGVLRRFNNTLGFGLVDNSATTATSASTPNSIVLRGPDGTFTCNALITLNEPGLIGQALSAVSANIANFATQTGSLQTSRNIELSGAVTGSASFDGSSDINIFTTGGGEINTGVSLGSGVNIFKEKSGLNLLFRSLSAGVNISVTATGNDEVVINNTYVPPAPQTLAKAWISFNGQTGLAYASYNVSSIQRIAKGVWYINLVPGVFNSTNYCVVTNTMQGDIPGVPVQAHGEVTSNNSGDAADSANARPITNTRVLYESWRDNSTLEDNVYNNIVIYS